jgi:hypothetical protein
VSDTRDKDPAAVYLDTVCAFVSDEGCVVGLTTLGGNGAVALCLAMLDAPVTITDWVEVLHLADSPIEAADILLEEMGGKRLHQFVRLTNPTYLPHRAVLEPGEA